MTISGYSGNELKFGAEVKVVKLKPDGSEAASYNAALVSSPPGWVVVRAAWTFQRMDLDHIIFEPDDYLLEYFPTDEPFNAFALYSPSDEFKGWYCNVTYPASVRNRTIYWRDLYVDVIQKADGEILVLDEDELEDAKVRSSDPELYDLITTARDSLVAMMRRNQYPFSEIEIP